LPCPNPNTLFTKANILIDENGHARLADFGLLTIVSDPTNFTSSNSVVTGGTTRWMSPELLAPDNFDLEDSRPTKESDCYALGMVIYEILSGQVPFAPLKDFIVMRKVVDGERPGRPDGAKGVWFTDDVWETANLCWVAQAGNRPNIEAVLECLERVPRTWKPPYPQVDEDVRVSEDDDWTTDLTTVSPMAPYFNPHCWGEFGVNRVSDLLQN
jgi:serine/threonine protein kinase